jgi:cell division protein FtsL
MAENTYHLKDKKERKSLFTALEKVMGMELLFKKGIPIQHIPKVIFITALIVGYIGLTHNSENKIRQINQLKKEVDDLRADYTTLKSEYMFESKQSEVAKKVRTIGLEESMEPPMIIEIDNGR